MANSRNYSCQEIKKNGSIKESKCLQSISLCVHVYQVKTPRVARVNCFAGSSVVTPALQLFPLSSVCIISVRDRGHEPPTSWVREIRLICKLKGSNHEEILPHHTYMLLLTVRYTVYQNFRKRRQIIQSSCMTT
jgi:hypothetical protein